MNYIEIEEEINEQLKKLNSKYNNETAKLVKSTMVFIKAGKRGLEHKRYGSLDIKGDIYYDVLVDYKRNDNITIFFKYNVDNFNGSHKVYVKL